MRPAQLLAVCAVTLLAGCGSFQWVREGATPEQLQADAAHCQQEAWHEARFRNWAFRPSMPIVLRDATGRTYLSHRPYDPFGDSFFEENRLAQFCMRAKGYRLENVEKAASAAARP